MKSFDGRMLQLQKKYRKVVKISSCLTFYPVKLESDSRQSYSCGSIYFMGLEFNEQGLAETYNYSINESGSRVPPLLKPGVSPAEDDFSNASQLEVDDTRDLMSEAETNYDSDGDDSLEEQIQLDNDNLIDDAEPLLPVLDTQNGSTLNVKQDIILLFIRLVVHLVCVFKCIIIKCITKISPIFSLLQVPI